MWLGTAASDSWWRSFPSLFDRMRNKWQLHCWWGGVEGVSWLLCRYLRLPLWCRLYLFVMEGIVIGEGVILDVFCDAVDFVLGFVDSDLRVGGWDGVDLAALFFLFEDGSFSDADGELNRWWVTLLSALETWGDSIFYRKRFLSIMI